MRAKPEPKETGLRIVGESMIVLRDPNNMNSYGGGKSVKFDKSKDCDTESEDDFNLDNFRQ